MNKLISSLVSKYNANNQISNCQTQLVSKYEAS